MVFLSTISQGEDRKHPGLVTKSITQATNQKEGECANPAQNLPAQMSRMEDSLHKEICGFLLNSQKTVLIQFVQPNGENQHQLVILSLPAETDVKE